MRGLWKRCGRVASHQGARGGIFVAITVVFLAQGGWAAGNVTHWGEDFPILQTQAVPGLNATGRALYEHFLRRNLPRAVAIDGHGHIGLAQATVGPMMGEQTAGGQGDADPDAAGQTVGDQALAECAAQGGVMCRLYAVGLDVVWPGHESRAPVPPDLLTPELSTWNDDFVPDPRFLWRGPQKAQGVLIWAHGNAGPFNDVRGGQPPAVLRPLNNAGYDVVRFDRQALADDRDRAAGWLRDALPVLWRLGYHRIVIAGQSRGGWNALQMLDVPAEDAKGLQAVIAFSPAAHGSGVSSNLNAQYDDLRALLADIHPGAVRVVMAQFQNDLFAVSPDGRAELFRRASPRLGGLLLIDRPQGLTGHMAAVMPAFAERYGTCLARFVMAPQPVDDCSQMGAP